MSDKSGSIEVICGCMFSGKTEELINRVKIAEDAGLSIAVFKHSADKRYNETSVVSHNLNAISAFPIETSAALLSLDLNCQVVAIDEAQFFDSELPGTCTKLVSRGIRVIIAGLDMDYKGQPFGPIPALVAIADNVTKLEAVCFQCGSPATYSYRTSFSESQILIGEKESYEPRCRGCFINGDLA
ncbi:MAG TPA: thymidine kinase [Pedobacter sp.]|jgi:thymidine kinase